MQFISIALENNPGYLGCVRKHTIAEEKHINFTIYATKIFSDKHA